ncbi:hypothetical protein D1AOALGA4SA_7728 [Olavius algarvensis Delta 1 endosymbiont]|nr:hypothetical protein D1AOALGA4SA_7728 [Olavius algarvensis Delta 1 endosymbiont]
MEVSEFQIPTSKFNYLKPFTFFYYRAPKVECRAPCFFTVHRMPNAEHRVFLPCTECRMPSTVFFYRAPCFFAVHRRPNAEHRDFLPCTLFFCRAPKAECRAP